MTPKQQLFVREYLIDLNATQAAKRAGYRDSTALQAAYRVLRQPSVAAAVEEGMAARARRTDIDADRVMREYAKLAFADIRRLAVWGKDGVALRDSAEVSDDDAAAIVELSRTGTKHGARIRIHDKRAALDALARHLGIFAKTGARLSGDIRGPALARARASVNEQIAKIIAERPKDGTDTGPKQD